MRRHRQVRANALRRCYRVITCLKHHCHESESSSIKGERRGARHCDRVGTNLMCHRERTGKGRQVTWDPGGKLTREEIIEMKGPVEVNENDMVGIDTCNRTPHSSQSGNTTTRGQPHTLLSPCICHPIPLSILHLISVSRPT